MAKNTTKPDPTPDAPMPASAAAANAVPAVAPGLDELGVGELRGLADANDIDIGNATRKGTIIAAIKAGNRKPKSKPASGEKAALSPEEKNELAAIDAEIAAIGDPRAPVIDLGEKLAAARARREREIKTMDARIGDLMNEHRQAQKSTGKIGDRLIALRARRDEILG